MQLFGPSWDSLEQSDDISVALKQIVDMVQAINCKLDQVKEDSQAVKNELARVTDNVEELKTEVLCLKKKLVDCGAKEDSSPTANILLPSLLTLVEKYNQTTNWNVLKVDLQKVLGKDSVEYHQLQNIDDQSWGHLWQVGNNGYLELATLLVNEGLPPNKADNKGDMMLHGAAEGGRTKVAQFLVDRGADVNSRGWRGLTPFNKAALGGKPEMVKWLAERGASIHSADDTGMTSLHFAAEHGHLEVVWILVRLGLDPNIRDVRGLTPLDWAKRNRSAAVTGYLSSHTY